MLKNYIGCKQIKAKPMTRGKYNEYRGWVLPDNENPADNGYLVQYSDNYVSWSPCEIFEKHYIEISRDNKISRETVKSFIREVIDERKGKTTLLRVVLINGFELFVTSSCVDPENYDHELGKKYAMEKAEDKIFELLGFLLQSAIGGVNK